MWPRSLYLNLTVTSVKLFIIGFVSVDQALHYFTVKAECGRSDFGVALEDCTLISDEIFSGHPHRVPECLVHLRKLLDESNGYVVEEIFRKQLDDESLLLARSQFDRRQDLSSLPPVALANLIKVILYCTNVCLILISVGMVSRVAGTSVSGSENGGNCFLHMPRAKPSFI